MNRNTYAIARDRNVTRMLREHGCRVHAGPNPALVHLSEHLGEVWEETDLAWRIVQADQLKDSGAENPLMNTDTRRNFTTAMATGYGPIENARVITLSVDQFEMLPTASEAGVDEVVRGLIAEPLPWGVTMIEVKAKRGQAPVLLVAQAGEGESEIPIRFLGATLWREGGDLWVLPYLEMDRGFGTAIITPRAARLVKSPDPDAEQDWGQIDLAAVGNMIHYASRTGLTAKDLDPDNEDAVGSEERFCYLLSLAALGKVYGALQVLSAINVTLVPKKLGGRNLKRHRREGHPVPHVVRVQKRHRAGSAEEAEAQHRLSSQHMVRGHWMHITKGPTFEANPEARRWISELNCEAVRIWRNPHIRGPENAPVIPTTLKLGKDT